MTIVWRGAGILVPIAFVASIATMNSWYKGTSAGDAPIAWALFWAALICLPLGLLTLPGKKTDPDTGVKVARRKHDFFFIPIIVWGLLFVGGSIYFFVKM